MKNIGIVCEGPTDSVVLEYVIDKITGEENQYFHLQPEDDLTGRFGNGWKGIWKWSVDHALILEQIMKDVTPQLDLVVIQMDGDVARKEREVHCLCETTNCEEKGMINPLECEKVKSGECPVVLPCGNHELSVNAYISHLTALITSWIENREEGVCVVIPCDSTEAWVIAAYDERTDAEQIEDPWESVISKGKKYHEIRISGHKKRRMIYRQFAGQICEKWECVKRLCISAAQFEENVRRKLR